MRERLCEANWSRRNGKRWHLRQGYKNWRTRRGLSQTSRERDTLKLQIEEQKKIRRRFPDTIRKGRPHEKPSPVTAPVKKEPETAEAAGKKTELPASRKENEGGKAEAETGDTGMVFTLPGIQAVPWRTGNDREDQRKERLLYEEAKRLNITGETKQFRDLIDQHKFDAKQQDALRRFLAVSEYIDQRLKRLPEEEVIESLIVTYEEENRYTKIVLARELQEKAKEGMPFEDIHKLYPDMMKYRSIPFQEMDAHTRDKSRALPVGEVGVFWSGDGYMILKPVLKKLSYDPFRNTHPEMQWRVRTFVNEWLQEMKSE